VIRRASKSKVQIQMAFALDCPPTAA